MTRGDAIHNWIAKDMPNTKIIVYSFGALVPYNCIWFLVLKWHLIALNVVIFIPGCILYRYVQVLPI